jgi:hypothetical protein
MLEVGVTRVVTATEDMDKDAKMTMVRGAGREVMTAVAGAGVGVMSRRGGGGGLIATGWEIGIGTGAGEDSDHILMAGVGTVVLLIAVAEVAAAAAVAEVVAAAVAAVFVTVLRRLVMVASLPLTGILLAPRLEMTCIYSWPFSLSNTLLCRDVK